MSTRLTIVTPSYNQAKFLDETLRSVLCQRDQIHEYFVFDGGSNDGSTDLIRKYESKIDYWESKKDKGQSDAIHKGFTRATGDVLGWLNSDDIFLPGALAKVRRAFDEHPEWDALTSYHIRIDADSKIVGAFRIPGESDRQARWGVHHVAQQTCFFRKRLYDRVRGIDQSLHCLLDTELWYRMWKIGSIWGHIPEYLAAFRIHPLAKGSSWQVKYDLENRAMSEKYPEYRDNNVRHKTGLLAYRTLQVLSGRHARGKADTKRWKGQTPEQIFGPFIVE